MRSQFLFNLPSPSRIDQICNLVIAMMIDGDDMVKCIFLSEQHCRFLDICQHLGAQLNIISCHINNITLNIVIITLLTLHYEVTTNIGTSLVPSKGLCCYCLFYVLQNPIKLPNINFRNSMRTCKGPFRTNHFQNYH